MKNLLWYCERVPRKGLALGCALVLAACTGELGGGPGPGAEGTGGNGGPGDNVDGTTAGGPNNPNPGVGSGGGGSTTEPPAYEAPSGLLRRLTRAQFKNAVDDLIGVEVNVNELDSDSFNGDFAAIGAATVVTSDRGVEQYHTAVEAAVGAAFADAEKRASVVGCSPASAEDPCVRDYLSSLGRRAWRRPLEPTELDRLAALAQSVATELESATEGVRWATVAVLTSPHFLYRPELGEAVASGPSRLTGYEIASRLAFLLWNTLPDEALLDDAASGRLSTSAGVRTAAERLLSTAGGRESVGAFAEEYMRLDRVLTQAKDEGLYPEYGPNLQKAMVADMRGVWEAIAFDDDASVLNLFTTTKAVVNSDLARLYGMEMPGLDSNSFQLVSLPSDGPRVGILGKLGFLSQFANQKEGSPTLRGKFIRDALMCTHVPAPPGNIALELPEPPADKPQTKRERLAKHRENPVCEGCHGLMDPMGLPLESFDAIGRFRTTELGLTIDPSGEFEGIPVASARELGEVMSESDVVAKCIVRKYYSYAVGHEERKVDEVVLNSLIQSFEASGFRLRPLILDVVSSDAFAVVAPQL